MQGWGGKVRVLLLLGEGRGGGGEPRKRQSASESRRLPERALSLSLSHCHLSLFGARWESPPAPPGPFPSLAHDLHNAPLHPRPLGHPPPPPGRGGDGGCGRGLARMPVPVPHPPSRRLHLRHGRPLPAPPGRHPAPGQTGRVQRARGGGHLGGLPRREEERGRGVRPLLLHPLPRPPPTPSASAPPCPRPRTRPSRPGRRPRPYWPCPWPRKQEKKKAERGGEPRACSPWSPRPSSLTSSSARWPSSGPRAPPRPRTPSSRTTTSWRTKRGSSSSAPTSSPRTCSRLRKPRPWCPPCTPCTWMTRRGAGTPWCGRSTTTPPPLSGGPCASDWGWRFPRSEYEG